MAQQVDDLSSKHSITFKMGHCRDENVAIEEKYGCIYHKDACKRVIKTKGWDIEIKLTDGTTFWCPFTTVKHSMPIELAEYAMQNDTSTKHAFVWWVTRMPQWRNDIINSIRIPKKLLKHGIKIPQCQTSIQQCYKEGIENRDLCF